MAGNKMSVAVVCLVALIQISSSLAATTWKVGDSSGWTNSGVDYTTWASGKTFVVGDTLDFVFSSGAHTVTEVSKADYDACSTSSPISNTANSPADIKLTTTGAHYYICQVGTHCSSNGQKLAITVSSSSSSTPSSPSPTSSTTPSSGSPSPSSSTTPSTPTSTTTSPPPPPSSSGVVAGAGLVMPFLIGAAAFLM